MMRLRDAASLRTSVEVKRCRPGFSMVEIVVVLAVVVILTAALGPNLLGVLDRKRVESAKESLDNIATAMSTMRGDNQDWPSRLTHLAWPILSTDLNICGGSYGGKAGQWAGPYLDRNVPAAGIPIGIGVVQDVLVREVVTGNDGYIKMQVNDVMEEDALELDRLYDGDGAEGGTVRWDAGAVSPSGQVTVFVLRPIRGC